MKAIIVLTILLLSSCTCEYKLNRVLKKCPSLVKGDTLVIHDTIVVNGVQKDTIFHYLQKDTIVIKEGALTMKYFYNTHDSTIYLNGKCDTIFVPVKYEVPTNQIVGTEDKYKIFFICFMVALIVALAIIILIK